MNERRAEAAQSHESSFVKCECECYRAECGESFQVSTTEYERVRGHGRRFLVAPGHLAADELLVSVTQSYFVIEKVGEEGHLAEILNPR